MSPKLTALAAATMLVVACGQNEASTISASNTEESFNQEGTKAAIDSSNEAFDTAFAKGDSATLVNFYLNDAKVYPPKYAAMDDNGMGSLSTHIPKMGISTTKLTAQEVLGGSDYAVEIGTYKMAYSAKTLTWVSTSWFGKKMVSRKCIVIFGTAITRLQQLRNK